MAERRQGSSAIEQVACLGAINPHNGGMSGADWSRLAPKIEHTSKLRGDHEGYDVLSFETSGTERLIEVKTTKYGGDTPFFVTRNEVATSERQASRYQLYRLFAFREAPRLYTLPGAIAATCRMSAATFIAAPR
jgi:Domain of unknown function (DUF3883)